MQTSANKRVVCKRCGNFGTNGDARLPRLRASSAEASQGSSRDAERTPLDAAVPAPARPSWPGERRLFRRSQACSSPCLCSDKSHACIRGETERRRNRPTQSKRETRQKKRQPATLVKKKKKPGKPIAHASQAPSSRRPGRTRPGPRSGPAPRPPPPPPGPGSLTVRGGALRARTPRRHRQRSPSR